MLGLGVVFSEVEGELQIQEENEMLKIELRDMSRPFERYRADS
ncbi:MAG: hypothetical protein R2744_08925 [Bacteroidales bacterium]